MTSSFSSEPGPWSAASAASCCLSRSWSSGSVAVAELRGGLVVGLALRLVDRGPGAARARSWSARIACDRVLLGRPALLHRAGLLLDVGQFLLECLEPGLGGVVLLLAQRLALDLELDPPPLELVELDRHRVDLHPQAARGLVDEVDRLVGQEALRDVAVGERGGGDERGVRDPDAVVDLVALAQTAQDRDRLLDRGLVDEDGLEAPFQRSVLLDVLAVFVERGCADRVQLAAGQHRLQQVGRVHRALRRAGTDHGVQLVDEQDDLPLGVLDLLQDGLEALLELAPVLGARDERAEVQRHDLLVLETLRDVAADDALGEALTIAVLPTPGSPMRTGLFFVRRLRTWMVRRISSSRPMTGSSLPGTSLLGQVAAVLLERLVGGLRVLRDVTRWPPRTLWSAWRIASRPAPALGSSWAPSPPASAMPRSRCSVET